MLKTQASRSASTSLTCTLLQRRMTICGASESLPSRVQTFAKSGIKWKPFVGTLFLTGAITGPLLDAIHSRVQIQIYDSLPIDITAFNLDFHSSVWVIPILGLFYVVLGNHKSDLAHNKRPLAGALHPLADFLVGDERPAPGWGTIALSFGVLALSIELSAWMYQSNWSYPSMHVTLSLIAFLNWTFFDRTAQGLILASICAIGAPIAELPFLLWLKWWHYTQPDLYLIDSWIIWCYFFYTPAVGNLARKLAR